MRRSLTVSVVGATGLVGGELLRVLEKRRFPIARLLPFSSGKSRAAVVFLGRRIPAPAPSFKTLASSDLVFIVSSDEVSRRFSVALSRCGIWTIDDSSAFRLDPRVPLVIPEVNADALRRARRLVAGPNCTLTGAAVAAWPLVRRAGVRAVRIASYQAVAGWGKDAVVEFIDQVRRLDLGPFPSNAFQGLAGLSRRLRTLRSRVLPRPIAMNLFPQVGAFNGAGDSSEEYKVAHELRKIWGLPRLPVSVTAVRVPVLRGHSLAVWLETRLPISPALARRLLRRAPGVRLWPQGSYPTPLDADGTGPVHVGRVRRGSGQRELCLWTSMDSLIKGAALNSVQIAEEILRRGWFP